VISPSPRPPASTISPAITVTPSALRCAPGVTHPDVNGGRRLTDNWRSKHRRRRVNHRRGLITERGRYAYRRRLVNHRGGNNHSRDWQWQAKPKTELGASLGSRDGSEENNREQKYFFHTTNKRRRVEKASFKKIHSRPFGLSKIEGTTSRASFEWMRAVHRNRRASRPPRFRSPLCQAGSFRSGRRCRSARDDEPCSSLQRPAKSAQGKADDIAVFKMSLTDGPERRCLSS
jgi:hypothetical protein